MSYERMISKLIIVVTLLKISLINVVPIKFINYSITLILLYVHIYIYI